MKKILLTIVSIVLLLLPMEVFAQATAPAGGTGLGTYTAGDMIYAASTNPIRFTKLNIGGASTCLTSNGSIPSWGTCAAGGSGGGSWSTTTSQVSGQLVNYSNNNTDVVAIGGTSTTTAKFWFDPNSIISFLMGKLGLGTTTPYTTLGVSGTIVADNFIGTSTNSSSIFPYASTTALTVSAAKGLTLGALNGPLQANGGAVSATTSVGFLYGGTGLTSAADDTTLVSSGTAWVASAVPNCTDSSGNHLNYTSASNAFSCGTTASVSGTVTTLTAGTNVTFSSGATCTTTCTINASGGGGGTGGGSWATTTSQTSGQLVNYSLNATDIVSVGGSSTTTDQFFLNPNFTSYQGISGVPVFQMKTGSINLGTTVGLQNNGFGTGFPRIQTSTSSNDVEQWQLENLSGGTNASGCIFFGNDITTYNQIGVASANYGGMCQAGSNYNIPGFNALKSGGIALFSTNFPVTIGSGAANCASSTLYIQAGAGLDASYDAEFTCLNTPGNQTNFGVATTTPWRRLSINGSSDLGNNALAGNFTATTSIASIFPYASSTSVTISGNEYVGTENFTSITGTNNNCLQVNTNGLVSGTGSACGGSGSQTPWTSDINGGGFNLTNVNNASSSFLTASSPDATSTIAGVLLVGTSTPGKTSSNSTVTVQATNGKAFLLNLMNAAGTSQLSVNNSGTVTASAGYNTPSVQITAGAFTCVSNNTCVISNGGSGAGITATFIGGAGVDSSARIRSTTGIGTSDSVLLQTGNNGSKIALAVVSNGNVGISTTTPKWILQVATTSASMGIAPQFTLSDVGAGTNQKHWSLESQAGAFYIATSSDSTFATSSGVTAFTLSKTGGLLLPLLTQSAANQTYYACGVATTFEMVWDTTTCLVSALKFKTDINPISTSEALSTVMSMQPVTYRKKDPLNKTDAGLQPGFIADSVKDPKLQETLVTHDINGDVHGFRYEQYTAYLTGAIQAQQKEIDELKLEIKKLRKQ